MKVNFKLTREQADELLQTSSVFRSVVLDSFFDSTTIAENVEILKSFQSKPFPFNIPFISDLFNRFPRPEHKISAIKALREWVYNNPNMVNAYGLENFKLKSLIGSKYFIEKFFLNQNVVAPDYLSIKE